LICIAQQALRPEIDAANDWIYDAINNGVYKCGFAQSQAAYDAASAALFAALDRLELLLSEQRYVAGSSLTEADVRAAATLLRFDEVATLFCSPVPLPTSAFICSEVCVSG
jgi:putative glutathione S-transferase